MANRLMKAFIWQTIRYCTAKILHWPTRSSIVFFITLLLAMLQHVLVIGNTKTFELPPTPRLLPPTPMAMLKI